MKPIRLEFAGLQSYREPQSIDFAALLGGGLFGIFGPTGSGKSTILDAITLALYGKVERARTARDGIINHAEKRLWVKFSFALNGAEGEQVYRVERSYARDGESSVRAAHCRMVAITAGAEQVLADGDRNVGERVFRLLGLTVDDFTRAVVLPQGTFAEFLKLPQRDRSQMLQRIFSLSQYGERLNQGLKQRHDQVKESLFGIERELIGLGDASDAAVAAAEKGLAQADQLLTEARLSWQNRAEQFRLWEEVWRLQQQLAAVQQEESLWQTGELQASAVRVELEQAVRAETIRRPLTEERQARSDAMTAAEKAEQAEASLATARAAESKAVASYQSARTTQQRELPHLSQRQHDLERAVNLEKESQVLAEAVAELVRRVCSGEEHLQQVQSQMAGTEAELLALQANIALLMQQMVAAEVTVEQRQLIQQGLRHLRELEQAERQLAETERKAALRRQGLAEAERNWERAAAERRRADAALAAVEQGLSRLESEPPAIERDLQGQESWLALAAEWVRAVQEAEAEMERKDEEAGEQLQALSRMQAELTAMAAAESAAQAGAVTAEQAAGAARERWEECRGQHLAAALSGSLSVGQPCPVCGSLEHPCPVQAESLGDVERAEAASKAAEAEFRAVDQVRQQAELTAAQCKEKVKAARMRSEAATEAAGRAAAGLTEARLRLPGPWQRLSGTEISKAMEQECTAHTERKLRFGEWREQVEGLSRQREEHRVATGQVAAQLSASCATKEGAEAALLEASAEMEEALSAAAACRAAFDSVRVGLSATELMAEEQRINLADTEAARLRQELSRSADERQRLEEQLKSSRSTQQKYVNALQERKFQLAQSEQQCKAKEQECIALTGGLPAQPQLRAVEATIEQLAAQEQTASAAKESAERRRAEAEAGAAAAVREQELTAKRARVTADMLACTLTEAGFADDKAAEAALRDEPRRQELDALLRERQRSGDRLSQRRAELEHSLAGRHLSAAEWTNHQTELDQARMEWEQRQELRSIALQAHASLKERQERWNQLQAERGQREQEQGHLADLVRVLRGNSLVEFLAEEQMQQVAQAASERLGQLTRHRYGLEVDAGGGFVIRDDANGGVRRPVTTLSGGETFLTSLALALALSGQIQLRGHYPLEFFFLDEGFGTLDPDLLDIVIDTLERLHFERLHVGIISHVPELRSRLNRRVIVRSAEPGGKGSQLELELA